MTISMIIQPKIREILLNYQTHVPSLKWDRCIYHDRFHELTVYGWIPLDKSRKDFVLITFNCDPTEEDSPSIFEIVTSSVRWSKKLNEIGHLDTNFHEDCCAIQPFLNGKNF